MRAVVRIELYEKLTKIGVLTTIQSDHSVTLGIDVI